MTQNDDRAARLAAQLRANLHRRKAHSRALAPVRAEDSPRAPAPVRAEDSPRAPAPVAGATAEAADHDDPPVAAPPPKP